MLDPAEPMEYYRLKEPDWPTAIGQGPPPSHLSITIDEHTYNIPWGIEVRASDSCDPERQVANLDHDPPLVHCRIIDELRDQFEHLPQ